MVTIIYTTENITIPFLVLIIMNVIASRVHIHLIKKAHS